VYCVLQLLRVNLVDKARMESINKFGLILCLTRRTAFYSRMTKYIIQTTCLPALIACYVIFACSNGRWRIQKAHFQSSALSHQFLKLDKFVWRDFLHSLIHTAGYFCTSASLKNHFFSYKVCFELHSRNTIHSQLQHRIIL